LARERYQDLLRDAARERQLNQVSRSPRHWPTIAAGWRTRLHATSDRLRLFSCRAAPAACPE
jgi:hypothetical protein